MNPNDTPRTDSHEKRRTSPSRNENVAPTDDPCCCCEPEPRWQELGEELGLSGEFSRPGQRRRIGRK